MITAKQLESVIKECLKKYEDDYNEVNKGLNDPVEFSLTLTKHYFDPSDNIPDSFESEEARAQYMSMSPGDYYYLRLTKSFQKRVEPRVIFAAYRPTEDFKTKDRAMKSLMNECLNHLIIGGVEYSEALYQMANQED